MSELIDEESVCVFETAVRRLIEGDYSVPIELEGDQHRLTLIARLLENLRTHLAERKTQFACVKEDLLWKNEELKAHKEEYECYASVLEKQKRELIFSRQWLRTTLNSIGDGVIVTDATGNVTLMNPVAERLTGWNMDEAKGRPIEAIFNIVNAKTRDAAMCPVKRVLKEGVIVGLANHTILINRNGMEFPIADSGAPIKFQEDGSTAGVVLVFRDVSVEYAQTLKMEEVANKFSMLFQTINDAVFLFELNSDGTPGAIVDVNQTAIERYGYSREEFLKLKINDLNKPQLKRRNRLIHK